MAAATIVCRGMTVGYGRTTVFEQASFRVGEGVTCLIGKNGAGKTTLFRVLAGIIEPRAGAVEVLGRDPFRDRTVRDSTGYLAHRPSLYRALTVEQNLRFWAKVSGLEWDTIAPRVAALVERFDLGVLLGKRAGALSRGQQQRVAIARMLLNSPKVVLMDEPSTGLDALAAKELHALVADIRRDGASVIYATHSLAEATELGDEFLLIANRSIVALGTRETLRRSDEMRSVRLRMTGNPAAVLAPLGIPCAKQGEYVEIALEGSERLHEVLTHLLQNGCTLLEMTDAVSTSDALLAKLRALD